MAKSRGKRRARIFTRFIATKNGVPKVPADPRFRGCILVAGKIELSTPRELLLKAVREHSTLLMRGRMNPVANVIVNSDEYAFVVFNEPESRVIDIRMVIPKNVLQDIFDK